PFDVARLHRNTARRHLAQARSISFLRPHLAVYSKEISARKTPKSWFHRSLTNPLGARMHALGSRLADDPEHAPHERVDPAVERVGARFQALGRVPGEAAASRRPDP